MVAGRQPVKLPYPFLDGLTRRQQEELYLDFQALANQGTGTRWATIVIAPSDATAKSKDKADYILDGASDSTTVQTAINTLLNRSTPGRVVFLEGTVYLLSAVTIDMASSTTGRLQIQGMGGYGSDTATLITNSGGSSDLFHCTGVFSSTTRVGFMGLAMSSNTASCITTDKTSVDIDACSFIGGDGGRLLDLNGGLSGPYAASRIRNSVVTSSGSSSANRGIVVQHEFDTIITGCTIVCSAGRALSIYSDAAATLRPNITNNHISGTTTANGIHLIDSTDATNVHDAVIANNWIKGFGAGVLLEGTTDTLIVGNDISTCTDGVKVTGVGIIGNSRAYIVSNYIHDCTSEGVNIDASTLGTSDISVCFNKFRANTAQGSIASSCSNCAWAYNDAYSTGTFTDAGSNTRTEVTFLPTTLDANARVGVRINTGGTTYLRRRINFIPSSSDFSLSMADDSGSEEIDLTLGIGSSIDANARVGVRKNSTGSTFARRRVNFIEGSGATITVADDSVNEEVDVTISVTAGAGGGDTEGEFGFTFDGGGSTIASGKIIAVRAPFAGTLDSWSVYLDVADTVSVEVWKDVYASYPPTVADKISASAPIATSAVDHATDSALTGWSTAVTAGDILYFKVTGVTVATRIYGSLHYTRP